MLDWWRARVDAAASYRDALGIDATAYRVIHGEADRLPGLVVDRYGDYLVLQALVQGIDRLLPELTRLLVERLQPAGILARNDPRVRLLEGLEQPSPCCTATVPADRRPRGPGRYAVDPYHGQKTGLFLDQRENRVAAASYARGRALDAFSYNGGFALALAPVCDDVMAVDMSEDAVARITANAARNGVTNVHARAMNVFDELRELERRGERFDTIVLDPPAFAKNKAAVPKALSGYKEINLRALKLLTPGGFLDDLQLFLQRQRGDVRRRPRRRGRRCPRRRRGRRKTDAGARSPGADDRTGDVLFEVLRAAKTVTVDRAASTEFRTAGASRTSVSAELLLSVLLLLRASAASS